MGLILRPVTRQELDAHTDRLSQAGVRHLRIAEPSGVVILENVAGEGPVLVGPEEAVYSEAERQEIARAVPNHDGAAEAGPEAPAGELER